MSTAEAGQSELRCVLARYGIGLGSADIRRLEATHQAYRAGAGDGTHALAMGLPSSPNC